MLNKSKKKVFLVENVEEVKKSYNLKKLKFNNLYKLKRRKEEDQKLKLKSN